MAKLPAALEQREVIGINPTPAWVSEHEEMYNDIPRVQRKSGLRGWLPCT